MKLDWADGEHAFRLGMGELEELDENCGVGPGYALGLIEAGLNGNWKAKMVREVIRLGLIGAGTDPVAALNLVRRYVDDRPLGESLLTAQMVLSACVAGGPEDDPPGESAGEPTESDRSPEAASVSPTSTPPARPRVSRRAKSAPARSTTSPASGRAGRSRTARTPKTS